MGLCPYVVSPGSLNASQTAGYPIGNIEFWLKIILQLYLLQIRPFPGHKICSIRKWLPNLNAPRQTKIINDLSKVVFEALRVQPIHRY